VVRQNASMNIMSYMLYTSTVTRRFLSFILFLIFFFVRAIAGPDVFRSIVFELGVDRLE
jgi:hypothetical protein